MKSCARCSTYFSFLLLLASCGKSAEKGHHTSLVTAQELSDEGRYRASLKPLNPGLGLQTSGTVEFLIEGDDLRISSRVSGAPALVKHYQHLLRGKSCPVSDANGDGVLDFAETISASGPILIPIDSDLSNQLVGMDYGPIASSAGAFSYQRSTSLSSLLDDLTQPDPDRSDAVAKLTTGAPLSLDGRAVVILGLDSRERLPSTVAGHLSEPPELMTPIACGTLVRVGDEGP